MSFGYGIGDCIAVGKLALDLYEKCYLVARGAPQEFRLVVAELQSLHMTMRVLENSLKDPDSVLVKAGDDRQRMVREMIQQTRDIVVDLQNIFSKHRNIGNDSRAGVKRGWDKFKWSLDAKDVDGLRNKLCYHNGVMLLLLNCAGNSSLQRLEDTSKRIMDGMEQLQDMAGKAVAASGTLSVPIASAPENTDISTRIEFSEVCLTAAETRGPWSTIGIEEWVHAGRWWLLQAEEEMNRMTEDDDGTKVSAEGKVLPEGAYINLHKASWILTGVINAHPQLTFSEPHVRLDILRLVEAVKHAFQRIQASRFHLPQLQAPEDLQIWEESIRGPKLKPKPATNQDETWGMDKETVIFRSFIHFRSEHHTQRVAALIHFLLSPESADGRIIVHDQGWRVLVEYSLHDMRKVPITWVKERSAVNLGGQEITANSKTNINIIYILCATYWQHTFRLAFSQHPDVMTFYACALMTGVILRFPNGVEDLLQQKKVRQYSADIVKYDASTDWETAPLTLAEMRRVLIDFAICDSRDFVRRKQDLLTTDPYPRPSSLWLSLHFPESEKPLIKLLWRTMGSPFPLPRYINSKYGPAKDDIESWTSLKSVISEGRDDVLIFVLETGVSPVESFTVASLNRKFRPLAFACWHGRQSMIHILLDRGAKEDPRCLEEAVKGDHEPVVRYLLEEKEVDPSTTGFQARTPLYYARSIAVGGVLVQYGADVRHVAKGADGVHRFGSVLHYAAFSGNQFLVDFLVTKGADVKSMDGIGDSGILGSAAGTGLLRAALRNIAAESTVEEIDIDQYIESAIRTPLFYASNAEVARILVESYPEGIEEALGTTRCTPLHGTAQLNHAEVARYLCDLGVSVDQADVHGRTPLHWAAHHGSYETAVVLVERGANLEARDQEGRTPLLAVRGATKLSQFLINAGADLSAVDCDGKTALHLAIPTGSEPTVQLLLDMKIDVNAKEIHGYTAFHTLVGGRENWSQRIADLLLLHGVDLEASDEEGFTALHVACISGAWSLHQMRTTPKGIRYHGDAVKGFEDAISWLIDHRVDLDAKNNAGDTALHIAAREYHESVFKLLRIRGADLHAVNKAGFTPLQLWKNHPRAANDDDDEVMELSLPAAATISTGGKGKQREGTAATKTGPPVTTSRNEGKEKLFRWRQTFRKWVPHSSKDVFALQ